VWITSLAFLAANLGAQEVIGMSASGAKYGIMTAHFYWVGAIPAMIFVGVFMMPFYYGSRARSVPEYLKLRFDEKTRAFNAITFAVMTVFSSGISMYALGLLLQLVLGWSFTASVLLRPASCCLHVPRRADQRDLQRGAAVLPDRARLRPAGHPRPCRRPAAGRGWPPRLPPVMTHSWRHLGIAQPESDGRGGVRPGAGLGFVLSFGYWCTDFLVVQRAMAAESMSAARRTPVVAAIPKMFIPFIVIVPGSPRWRSTNMDIGYALPPKNGGPDYDQVLTTLMAQFYPAGMLGVGLTAHGLLHVGHGGQRDRLQHRLHLRHLPELHPPEGAPDRHYLWMGRMTTVFGVGALDRHRLPGAAVQQHHGPAAAGLRVRERAAVRDVPAGHVLEARHRPRGLHRAGVGHRAAALTHGLTRRRGQGRLARDAARVPVDDGPELLDRHPSPGRRASW
jgi:solute:Na+ symporter, SSS family